ncbi:uncharacterized protein LOC144162339 [Haemaphysalis longicornis]
MAAKKAGGGSGRLSYTEAMEKTIREMGDIDEFVNAEDVIVLKVDTPLPAKCRIPSQLAVDADRTRLTTNCKGLTGCLRFLARYRYPSVLLAGLPKLASAPSFLAAAREVLCGTQTLIIVHNRDHILDLVGWFPCPTLMLYHDLITHQHKELDGKDTSSKDKDGKDNTSKDKDGKDKTSKDKDGKDKDGNDNFSHLVAVYGTVPALGCDQLCITNESIRSLLENTGKLSTLQAPMREVVLSVRLSDTLDGELSSQELLLEHCEEMTLGFHVYSRWDRTIEPPARADVVKGALALCPNHRRLKVTTDSKEVFPLIAKFSRLVRLSVMYVGKEQWLPFDPNVTRLLQSLPSLTHLALTNFQNVSLLTINMTCENLQSLTLAGSRGVEECVYLAFPKLTSLTISDCLPSCVVSDVVMCALFTITDLCIEGTYCCGSFITYPPPFPFRHLQRLTLKTDKPLLALLACPENLHTLFGRMPALEQLMTDSYDIRLFVQCYLPHVKLDWTQCVVCDTEYPKVNAVQE